MATSPILSNKLTRNPKQTPTAPTPIVGRTADGQPIYPVVGYTASGEPITADKAQGYQPMSGRTNTMAIAALITSFFFPLFGIIFGHIAKSQIRRTGEHGSGFALAGLIVGYVSMAGYVLLLIVMMSAFS